MAGRGNARQGRVAHGRMMRYKAMVGELKATRDRARRSKAEQCSEQKGRIS